MSAGARDVHGQLPGLGEASVEHAARQPQQDVESLQGSLEGRVEIE